MSEAQPAPPTTTCYRHPDRPTGIVCARCGRPICPECMRPASVGFHCPECVREGNASIRAPKRATGLRSAARRWGPVTLTLIGINIAVAVVCLVAAALAGNNPISTFSSPVTGAFAFSPYDLAQGQWWRVVTSAFTHTGLVHLALNMLSLLIFGSELERLLGRGRYLTVYLVSAAGGAVSLELFGAYFSSVVGASGAIFGLIGAFGVMLLKQRQDVRGLLTLLGINLVVSFLPGISLLGHLGGLVAGALTAAALLLRPRQLAVGGVVAVTAVLLAVLLLQVRVSTSL